MRKLGAVAAVAAFTGVTLMTGIAPAQADYVYTRCETGQFSSNASGEYVAQGATQFWATARWIINGPGLRNSNNTNIRLRVTPNGAHDTSHRTYFSYDSPDNLAPATLHQTGINRNVPTSENIYMKFETFFDRPGDDPHCEMYTAFV